MTAAEIAQALGKAKAGGNGWWTCLCPAHEDKTPSLSLKDGDKTILVKCHAGCSAEAVIAALKSRGLWPEKPNDNAPNWIYELEDGSPYLGVVRYTQKDGTKGYAQYHWGTNGDWVKGKPTGPKIPYRLPELVKADEVFITEGEKCADRLAAPGLAATSASEGAGKWTPDLNPWFAGKAV
jgi:hypothetical protein